MTTPVALTQTKKSFLHAQQQDPVLKREQFGQTIRKQIKEEKISRSRARVQEHYESQSLNFKFRHANLRGINSSKKLLWIRENFLEQEVLIHAASETKLTEKLSISGYNTLQT